MSLGVAIGRAFVLGTFMVLSLERDSDPARDFTIYGILLWSS